MGLTKVELKGLDDGTDGQIITYDANGNPVTVGPGTDGQVLTSTGAGSPPAFETPAAGVGGATGVDFNDSVKARFGTGNDLEIYHTGSANVIAGRHASADLYIQTNNDIYFEKVASDGTSAENLAKFVGDGNVELYHNGSKVLWTDSNGFNAQAASGDFHFKFLSAGGNEWGIYNQDNNMRFMEDSTERMRISSNGNVGAPNGSNIYNASDQRLKNNITTLTNGLDKIKALNPVSFNWIDGFCDEEKDKTLYGVIAQEAQVVDSNLVNTFSTGTVTVKDQTIENTLTVNEKFIIPLLIKAVQELSAEVETLKTKVAALEAHTHE